MIHQGTKELHTDRLILRRFTLDDAQEMFDNWVNNDLVAKFLNWQPHGSIDVTKALLVDWINDYQKPNSYNWGIVYENKLIGSIGLLNPNEILFDVGGKTIVIFISADLWT